MSNNNGNISEPTYSSWEWILPQTTTCLFVCADFYILVCLLAWQFRPRALPSHPHSPQQSETAAQQLRRLTATSLAKKQRTTEDKRKIWLNTFTILACASALFKSLSNEIDLIWGQQSQTACTLVGIFQLLGYGSNVFCYTIALWIRQAAVQSSPALSSLPGKKLRRFLSWFFLIFLFVVFGVLTILNTVTLGLVNTPNGCYFNDHESISQVARSVSGLIFTVTFEPALVALLLYPLLKTLPKAGSGITNTPAIARVRLVIKRTLVCIVAILLSDIGSIVVSFYLEQQAAIWIAVVYDINCFVGVVGLVCTYHDWKRRLRLGRGKRRARGSSDTGVATVLVNSV